MPAILGTVPDESVSFRSKRLGASVAPGFFSQPTYRQEQGHRVRV